MNVVEPEFDERLDLTFDRRRFPQVYVIEDRWAYAWDKSVMPTEETFTQWVIKKEFKNSVQ